ncbi:hypothetical protein MMC30_001620 [Trapelia coarctata]|nr:hypothetical protein [Trapelia coarctata]
MAASGDTNTNTIPHHGDSISKEGEAKYTYQRMNLSNDDPERIVVPCPLVDKDQQDPFGSETSAGVKYRTLSWVQCGMLMIAETVSLGILSLPSSLAILGIVPGLLLILVLGILATYTGYVIGQFKARYPQVHSMADAGMILLGPFGRELFGFAQLIFFLFIMASHILTFTIMLNTITSHGTCTIIYGVIGVLVSLLCTLPRRLGDVTWMAWVSFVSIIAAVVVTITAVAIENSSTPSEVQVTRQTTLFEAFLAVTNIIFAYAGHVAFFSFISELEKQEDYPKSLCLLQIVDTTMYLIVAAVMYRFAGPDVASPALGSASSLFQKISYGVAIPTIVIAGVINGHVAAKYIYIRLFRGTDVLSQKTFYSRGMWALIAAILWVLAWLIAEAIPVFNNLLGLVSALFASWFTYGLAGVFWLFMNWGLYGRSWKKMLLTGLNVGMFLIGGVICGLGLYSSSASIAASSAGPSFSCADNSQGHS